MKSKLAKRLSTGIITIFILSFCLAATTFALVYSMVVVENNVFATGKVGIDLNGGKSIISEDEYIFEPGMTVIKDFYIQNESTCDIYYKFYFANVSGGLEDYLQVKICIGDRVLYEGTPSELNRKEVSAAADTLAIDERRELRMIFYFPPEVGNEAQNLYLSFDFAADAVQTKNNYDKKFD